MRNKIRIGNEILVEQAWEDENGNYHDEYAKILDIKDGKMKLKFKNIRKDVEEFLQGSEFFIKDFE